MSTDVTCPSCARPIPAPALDVPSNCPYCGSTVVAARKSDIQAGAPEAVPQPTAAVQRGMPRRLAALDAGWGTDDELNIRVPVQPVELRGRTNVAVVLIALVVLADIAIGSAEFYRFTIIERVRVARLVGGARGVILPEQERQLERADRVCLGLSGLRTVVYMISIITYMMWVYRAYANLTALRAAGMNHTPGWAVGVHFIPFVNIVRGCTVMQEIWKGSDPQLVATERQWQTGSAGIIVLWWLVYLASIVLNSIARNMSQVAEKSGSLDAFASAEKCSIAASGLAIFAGIMLIYLVFAVTRRQQERLAALHEMPA